MKRRILTSLIALAMIIPVSAQQTETKTRTLEELEKQSEITTPPDTLVNVEEIDIPELPPVEEPAEIDETAILSVEDTSDETVIRIGSKGVRIIEGDGDTDIRFQRFSDRHSHDRFRGHLGGIEFGYNSYLSDFWSTALDPQDSYMNLNSAKSTSFNILFPNISLGITRHFGFVSSIGFNFNNYRFDGNNSIGVDATGVVQPVYPGDDINYQKSKLATVYAVLPVMLEAQIPTSSGNSVNFSFGVIGGLKLGSHTKVVYYADGKQKDKNRDDFSLNLLRYGATARIGYEMIQIYGTCYLSPLFEKGMGPELYPFEVGIALSFND